MAINRANGSVTGVNNKTSGGGNSISRITASTTFEVQPGTTEVDVLVVAGGGGGGNTSGEQGGGGGAGGFRNLTNQAVSPGSKIPVTVGAGGSTATAGSDSVFSNPANPITADGGGLGGGGGNPAPGPAAGTGGSGGGGGWNQTGASGNTPPTSPAQGSDGGNGQITNVSNMRGGAGGGGAGGAAVVGTGASSAGGPGNRAGSGGIGAPSSITGTNTLFGGGGGGGALNSPGPPWNTTKGAGGVGAASSDATGGGGAGAQDSTAAVAGSSNTGGGGGGSSGAATNAAAGGSGVVIVKEKNKANGVFNMNSQYNAVKRGQWPTIDKTENANVTNSLRFNDDDSPKLSRAVSTSGSSTNATLSVWVKRSSLGTRQQIYSNKTADSGFSAWNMYFNASNDRLYIDHHDGSNNKSLYTTQVFRDVSAWYHIVHTIDTTAAEATNRLRLYINGEEVTDFATDQAPDQDSNLALSNSTGDQSFGDDPRDSNDFFDGYMADIYYIDGLTLPCTHFGEPDSDNPNIWQPKKYIGNFGTNGFHLEFKQSGTSQNSSGIGADTSGNDNHLAVTNLAAIDQTTDTPTNNFATLNPLSAGSDIRANGSFKEGNCELVNGDTTGESNGQKCSGTMGFANGKWYWEVKLISNTMTAGIVDSSISTTSDINLGSKNAVTYDSETGAINNINGAVQGETVSSQYDDGDIIGVAVDADNGAVYFSKNGTYQNSGNPTSGASKTGGATFTLGNQMLPLAADNSSGSAGNHQYNFGNPPFSISSGNSDANGHGNFEYAVPSGYFALCTKNLAQYG